MTAAHVTAATVELIGAPSGRTDVARKGFLIGFKPTTRASYDDGLSQWFDWCAASRIDPLQVSRAHIEMWGRWLEECRNLNPSTVAHRLVTLRSFYRYCEDEGFVERSPAYKVRLPQVSPESSTHGMTRSEVSRLFAVAARVPVQHALVCLCALNGLRVSEACAANIEGLSFELGHRTLTVLRKGGRRHTIPVPPAAGRVLDKVIAGRTSGPILLTAAGTRMTRHNAWKIVDRLGKKAGLSFHVHPHMLRHSFATVALDAGVPLHDVQDSMNHTDPRSTMRYNRNRNRLDRNAAHIVSAFIASD